MQLYIFTKADVPMDVDFMITDTFEVRDLSGAADSSEADTRS